MISISGSPFTTHGQNGPSRERVPARLKSVSASTLPSPPPSAAVSSHSVSSGSIAPKSSPSSRLDPSSLTASDVGFGATLSCFARVPAGSANRSLSSPLLSLWSQLYPAPTPPWPTGFCFVRNACSTHGDAPAELRARTRATYAVSAFVVAEWRSPAKSDTTLAQSSSPTSWSCSSNASTE